MDERTAILERVRQSAAAAQPIRAALDALPAPTAEAIYAPLRGYILARLALPAGEAGEEDGLLALCERSLARYIRLVRAGAIPRGRGDRCSNASSVVVKKVLLMKAIQTDCGVSFTPARSAELTTVRDLAREIARQRGDSPC